MKRRFPAAALAALPLVVLAGGCAVFGDGGLNPPDVAGTQGVHSASRPSARAAGPGGQTTVAIISDFGQCDDGERAVAELVRSWDPALIFTAGDNSQGVAGCVPFTESVDAYYGDYVRSPQGPRLFPVLGNHDYDDDGAGLAAYRSYFTYLDTSDDPLGRWYVKSVGNINVYVLDSNAPDDQTQRQQQFLKSALGQADQAAWDIVIFHHPPFTSGPHDPRLDLRPEAGWAFKEWGADVVINGHQHVFEDVVVDGLHYITAGVGGQTLVRRCATTRTQGSLTCIEGIGALKVVATDESLDVSYIVPGSASDVAAYSVEVAKNVKPG